MLHLRFHETHAHFWNPVRRGQVGATRGSVRTGIRGPRFLIVQASLVLLWIAANAVALTHFDPYPFILLNLAFGMRGLRRIPLSS